MSFRFFRQLTRGERQKDGRMGAEQEIMCGHSIHPASCDII